jgi:hypothetical protein
MPDPIPLIDSRSDAELAELDRQIAYCNDVGKRNGLISSTWAIDDVVDFELPHPYLGAARMHFTTYAYWTGRKRNRYEINLQGRRWLELWMAADALIAASGDHRNVYIEGFTQIADRLTIRTGS